MEEKSAVLSITLFGGFTVEYGCETLNALSPRADNIWRLMRYLLINRGKFLSSAALLNMLFPGEDILNPRKSLQNLVYRLRKILPETDKSGNEYILSQHRNYGWNEQAEVYVDVFEFEELARIINTGAKGYEIEAAAMRMLALYKGEFLENATDEPWAESQASHYNKIYFDCMNTLLSLLYEQGKYAEVADVCTEVLKRNMFEEHFHILLINAMIAQGNRYGALTHYRSIHSLLKNELNIEPSEELRAAGRSINANTQSSRPDIGIVIDELRAASAAAGPMFCEIDVFRQIFQLYERMNHREDFPSMIVLYTVVSPTRQLSDQEMFRAMAALKRACMISLRRSDVVTQHSNKQLLMMLPSADEMSISIVLTRIQQKFTQLCFEEGAALTTQVRSLILPKTEV